jgi:hypothetical protein
VGSCGGGFVGSSVFASLDVAMKSGRPAHVSQATRLLGALRALELTHRTSHDS